MNKPNTTSGGAAVKKAPRPGPWYKKPGVRHTLKVLSAIMKCLLTIVLIGVITASIVGCVMVIYVVNSFRNDAGIPGPGQYFSQRKQQHLPNEPGDRGI